MATITVSATDPSYKGAATTFKVTVQNTNDPPVLAAAIPSQSVDQRQTFRYTIPAGTFSDPDGDPLSLSLSGSAPSWLSLSGNIVSGTPTSEADCRNWNIGVRAADPSGSIAEAVFLLTVNNVNDPPIVAKPIPDQSAEQGHEFQFTVPAETFTDPEGKSLTYWSFQNKGQMPAWMSFDQGSRTFSGTPSQSDVGIHKVTVSATDPSYKGIATTFKITVKDVPENKPPEIIDIPDTIFWLPGSRPAAISGTSLIISDPDSPDFNGGFLEIKLNNALDGDYIYCPNISSGIGDLTRYNNTHFRIDLKEMSYPVEINKLMYNITYSNTLNEPPPGVRDLIVILNDGDGGETIV